MGKYMQILGLCLMLILFGSCLLPYALELTKPEELPLESPYSDGAFALIDDVWVHYRLLAPKKEILVGKILLVHGLGGSIYSFQAVIPALVKAGYMVIAVDLPGFGYSGRPENFDHSQAHRATILWQLLDTLDDSEQPWVLLGHSMGGGTATAMALERPKDTMSLVLVAGALEDFSFSNSLLLKFPPLARWVQLYLERTLLTEKQVGNILFKAYGREANEEEIRAYLEPLQLPGTARGAISFVKTSHSVPLEDLSTLDMPVIAIWGALDTVVPLEKKSIISERVSQLQLAVLPEAAHIPMETHPEQFNAILLEFLSSMAP